MHPDKHPSDLTLPQTKPNITNPFYTHKIPHQFASYHKQKWMHAEPKDCVLIETKNFTKDTDARINHSYYYYLLRNCLI